MNTQFPFYWRDLQDIVPGEKLLEWSEEVLLEQGRGGLRWLQFKAKYVIKKTEINGLFFHLLTLQC